ncbi:hypothetical protein EXT68_15625 [Pectobacterium parmentieri]|uniref:Uncharacterized protein n=1 Tax=Pectobacterium parmentieri TaxID=1905730 RepID=A0A0H3I5I1_PECPM|nr:hypothetical protein [Pectobacterium parmentieri]AFI90504.1 Hypothetical protein W5S_2416 [Pectobacterium parmentieri]MBI0473285.1 hypothetical protein [Pectobacterium parmentieri]MBI0495908.1 hypothetical protein [Pectobacterium parmentieri]MBI0557330.1 hypothetical protein [Pectobacterium parmentieri]MBI0570457.1 hypothetical protein [Pectobacterium parmentieri]
MSFISEYIAVLLVTFALITIFASFKGLKGQKEDSIQIQQWLTRESWKGEVAQGKLKTWKQTTTTNNYNHYYILTFEFSFGGTPRNYSAVIVLNASEVIKLKKGVPLKIKHQEIPPENIAVLSVEFDN